MPLLSAHAQLAGPAGGVTGGVVVSRESGELHVGVLESGAALVNRRRRQHAQNNAISTSGITGRCAVRARLEPIIGTSHTMTNRVRSPAIQPDRMPSAARIVIGIASTTRS